MSLALREAQAADLPGVLALYAQPSFDDGAVLSLDDALALWQRFAQYPNYTLWVATEADEVVGTYALLIMDNLAHRGTPSAIVEDVVVSQARQGQGIGREMMAHAMARARLSGCYKLVLSSNDKRQAAHAFYEGLGFQRHGQSFVVELQHGQ